MFKEIKRHCDNLATQFHQIPEERKAVLSKLAGFMQQKKDKRMPVRFVYICTHNSRRSHMGQVWGAVAAAYYGIPGVETFSGGTEATAVHPNVIDALRVTGFRVHTEENASNPVYRVYFGDGQFIRCFSKAYNDRANPREQFAAVMTCSDADENCPFIPGVELRVGTTYDDPKIADNTPRCEQAYLDRLNQIALEILYTCSLIR